MDDKSLFKLFRVSSYIWCAIAFLMAASGAYMTLIYGQEPESNLVHATCRLNLVGNFYLPFDISGSVVWGLRKAGHFIELTFIYWFLFSIPVLIFWLYCLVRWMMENAGYINIDGAVAGLMHRKKDIAAQMDLEGKLMILDFINFWVVMAVFFAFVLFIVFLDGIFYPDQPWFYCR